MKGFASVFIHLVFVTVALAQSEQRSTAQKPVAAEAARMAQMQANAAFGPGGLRIQIQDWSKLDHTVVDTCANRGAEQGFANWSLLTGRWGTGAFVLLDTPTPVPPETTTSRFAITPIPGWDAPVGFDPWVGTSTPQIPTVFSPGAQTFRLGNHRDNFEAEAMYQTFTVTTANADYSLDYAVALENPAGHGANGEYQPFVGIYFLDAATGLPLLDTSGHPVALERVADVNDTFFHNKTITDPNHNRPEILLWREVSCAHFDLSRFIGKNVTVMYVTADCGGGAHFGYAYFDGKCGPPDPPALTVSAAGFCPTGGSPVTATASSTVGVLTNTWTIVQTDSNGASPVTSTMAAQTFNGPMGGPRNLSSLYAAQGKQFECGKYYRVTLNITTECGTNSASRVVFINCPPVPVIAGPLDTCSNGTYCIQPRHGITHSWTVQGGTPSSTTGTCINVTWGPTGPYSITVTATNPTGCSISKKIEVAPCNCCRDTRLTTGQATLSGGAGGIYTFNAPLTLTGFGPVTQVTASVVSASVTPTASGCGTGGPVNATIPSGATVAPFNGPLLNAIPGTEIGWSASTPVTINGTTLPFQIQFAPPAPSPCADILSFCIRYTFTGPSCPGTGGCRTCSFVVCHRVIRSCDAIIWPDRLPTLTDTLELQIVPQLE